MSQPAPTAKPQVVDAADLPQAVRILDPAWIPLSDGTRLAARIWLPEDPVAPGVLEAMPYRRGDLTLVDDEVRFGYVAAHGYACVRVDLRGSGDSEGILDDEYSPQEQADLVEVIAWIAEQPWCTGAVGMTGISWSGFNSLEVAAHRPPALKAIITVCSSDDRYDNDVHYIGGAVLAFYMAVWGHVMLAFNARPPDPDVVGEQWRAIWLDRLERNRLMTETWLAHQTRDHYWAQGSVIEDYAAIRCPVLAVGGWSDAYTDTLLRLGAGLSSPVRVIVGPWGHTWPERGAPGPAIGFLQECVSWWDRWLKDIPNGADEEPLLRYYRQEYATPRADLDERPGRWLAAASIPTVEHGAHGLDLGNRTIGAGPSGDILSIRTAQSLGALAGSWLPYGNPTDLPPDQSPEDAGSLVFDSAPFTADLDVLGQPVLEVVVSSDRPQANLVVRLCEIAPDGSSALLTRGVLNLTHRGGHKQPEPLEPGCTYRVRVPLKAIGVRIAAGHRLRVAVSTTYWPWVWPSPEEATVSLHLGAGSRLLLPTPPDGVPFTPFAPPVTAAPPEVESLRERRPRLGEIAHDPVTGEHVYALRRDLNGIQRFPSGLVYDDTEDGRFTITDGDPLSARVELHRVTSISRGGWRTTVETESEMWSTAADFHLRSRQVAHEGDHVVFEREITATLPRRLT